ncbi:adenosylcobalamin-dependent ribonucleoside-diphosphate reductase [Achromobacter aloeverae]
MSSVPDISDVVFANRYARDGEATRRDTFLRVATALAARERAADRHRYAALFLENFMKGGIGAGRIMANAGAAAGDDATMVNCFVQAAMEPALGWPYGVDAALSRAVRTMNMGGGVGYDFTPIPPASSTGGGVCAVIDRYDRICRSQHTMIGRPAAQMGVLACDHPDILEFIAAKEGRRRWPTFNLAVAVGNAFMEAVQRDELWTLSHRAEPARATAKRQSARGDDGRWRYGALPARQLWDALTGAVCRSAAPGVLFIDTVNEGNPLRGVETLSATNPCGEQPLPAYGACVLGPINLAGLVRHPFGHGGAPAFDFEELGARVRVQVRMLDNVLDLTRWPLQEQAAEAKTKRRIGCGVTGLADALAMMGLRYDSQEGRALAVEIAGGLRDHAYLASAELAGERGAFPLYRQDFYLDETAAALHPRFAPHVTEAIRRHGLRNSHLLSFAPAGSVSVAFFGNCSPGIEPVSAWRTSRHVCLPEGDVARVEADNAAWRLWRRLKGENAPLPAYFQRAADISPAAHVAMVAALQPWVDASISKHVPLPAESTPGDVSSIYFQAWRAGVKGLTVFSPDPAMPAAIEDTGAQETWERAVGCVC